MGYRAPVGEINAWLSSRRRITVTIRIAQT